MPGPNWSRRGRKWSQAAQHRTDPKGSHACTNHLHAYIASANDARKKEASIAGPAVLRGGSGGGLFKMDPADAFPGKMQAEKDPVPLPTTTLYFYNQEIS